MKKTKITYWTCTVILAAFMGFSAYAYFTNPMVQQGFTHLGFPGYFRVELGLAKLIGAIVLLIPLGYRIKEWAYAGFGITFISAFIAHSVSGDPMQNAIMPVIFMLPLVLSYISWHKLQAAKAIAA